MTPEKLLKQIESMQEYCQRAYKAAVDEGATMTYDDFRYVYLLSEIAGLQFEVEKLRDDVFPLQDKWGGDV